MTEKPDEGAVAPANEPAVTEDAAAANSQPAETNAPDPDAELSALYDKITTPEDEGSTEPEGAEDTDQPSEDDAEPVEETPAIVAPDSWSAEMKEQWASLPAPAQEYVAQREKEAHSQISRMGQELSQWKPIAELRDKTQHLFDRQGVDFKSGLERLLHAQSVLDQNPLQGIAAIAQTYGVDLAQAFGGQPQQAVNPEFARLQQELNQAKAVLTNQQREDMARKAREERELSTWAAQQVEAWRGDKEYLDEVQPIMQKLLEAGVATDLDDAYQTAIYRHPEVRAKIEAAKQAEIEAKSRAEQEKALKEAKRAARINTGDRPAMPKPQGKWDDDSYLAQVYDAVAAG